MKRRELRYQALTLVLWRFTASFLLCLVVAWLYWPAADEGQQQELISLLWLAACWLLLSAWISRYAGQSNWFLFLVSLVDVLFVGLLIWMTDGFFSPFVLLFGLLIVAAGMQAHVMLVLSVTVLACATYLSAVYASVWLHMSFLPHDAKLKLLLQVSVFLLIGGVMASIARRHARLADESREAVQAHEALQQLHSQVMSSMQEGLLVMTDSFHIVDANAAVCRMLGLNHGQANRSIRMQGVLPDALWTDLEQGVDGVLRMEWAWGDATYLLNAGGFVGDDGQQFYWLTLVDVTELRHLEHKLAEQERLAAMGRLAAMLAHEFRNPMQTIAQATELMAKLPASTQERVQSIVLQEVDRLNRLVTDMVDYARPQAVSPVRVNVLALLHGVVQQAPFADAGIQLSCEVDTLYVDAHQWQRVLENLLYHAVAASPEAGSVSIIVKQEHEAWVLSVMDQGEVMDAEMQQRMWEPFGEHRGGTGLGLAAVWHMCEVNHWELSVESREDATVIQVRGSEGLIEDTHG